MDKYLESQVKEALENGARQIQELQREAEILRVKAGALDTIDAVFRTIHQYRNGGGMAWNRPDGAQIMQDLLRRIEEHEKAEAEEAASLAKLTDTDFQKVKGRPRTLAESKAAAHVKQLRADDDALMVDGVRRKKSAEVIPPVPGQTGETAGGIGCEPTNKLDKYT